MQFVVLVVFCMTLIGLVVKYLSRWQKLRGWQYIITFVVVLLLPAGIVQGVQLLQDMQDIQDVKDATLTHLGKTVQIGPAITARAGVTGKTTWTVYVPRTGVDPDFVMVEADIERSDKEGKGITETYIFNFNRSSRTVDLAHYELDGYWERPEQAISTLIP